MKNSLSLTFLFLISFWGLSQNWSETQKIVPITRAAGNAFGGAVSINNNFALIGAHGEDVGLPGSSPQSAAGAAYFFQKNTTGQWIQHQKIVASDREAGDEFGVAVDLSNQTAIVGAKHERDDVNGNNSLIAAGAAYIFEINGNGTWSEAQKLVASDRATLDRFGLSVSISGNYALIGVPEEDEDENGMNTKNAAGSAYIFERNTSGQWIEVQKLVASDRDTNDYFGNSVAISGNYALISASAEEHDSNGQNSLAWSGSAYVFERNANGQWIEVQKITPSLRSAGSRFGFSVALDGNTAIIGADRDGTDLNGNLYYGQGSAFIFEGDSTGHWAQVQKIIHPNPHNRDEFGATVDIWGDQVIIGNFRDDEDENNSNLLLDAGAAFIYEKSQSNGQWLLTQKVVNSDRAHLNWFATNVAISNGYAFAGAPWESEDSFGFNSMPYAGAAYIFKAQGGILDLKEEEAFLKFSLFPNPNQGQFSLDLGAIYPKVEIRITDLQGRVLWEQNYTKQQHINLDLQQAPGVYFLTTLANDKQESFRLLVK